MCSVCLFEACPYQGVWGGEYTQPALVSPAGAPTMGGKFIILLLFDKNKHAFVDSRRTFSAHAHINSRIIRNWVTNVCATQLG